MNKFEQALSTVGKDALDVLESPAKLAALLAKTEKVFATALAEQSELKSTVVTVTQDGIALSGQLAAVVASKGENWIQDAALVAAVEQFFAVDVEGKLVPVVESLYGQIEADVQ